MLRTKIVCTIGPASRDPETLAEIVRSGMDVARLNFSHGTHADHAENIRRIREAGERVVKPVAVLGDLQGPKLRVGIMREGGVQLAEGETLALTTDAIVGEPGRVPVQYDQLPAVVEPGDRILIDDGLLELRVDAVDGATILTTVITGGRLNSNKGLNLPRAAVTIPAITEKDREDLAFAIEAGVDWLALSFVRTAAEVLDLKATVRELSPFGHVTPVMAKIEKPEAIENIDEIIAAADGIMVARGDLGIEISPEAVPMLQKMIIAKANHAGKPVVTATQMLDSMIRNPRPTRAEASDVANAILDGTDAIMLSGETASGRYPVDSVRTMVRIAAEVESAQARLPARQLPAKAGRTFAEAIAHAAVETAIDLSAAAIITPTVTGQTACVVSRYRPPCPVIAVTPSPFVQRELMLVWGVYPLLASRAPTIEAVLSDAMAAARAAGFVDEGDVVVLTGGTSPVGHTNTMKVDFVERILGHGEGLGERRVIGRVRRLEAPVPAGKLVEPDEIVVAQTTDRTFLPVLRRAAGLVTANPDPAAHCRLAAMELGLPAVVGIQEGLDAFYDGQQVLLEPSRGLVIERPPALWRAPGAETAAG
jgi:pyruvate kinase